MGAIGKQPAFPRTYTNSGHDGMDLRTYAAITAMQGMLASCVNTADWPGHGVIAEQATKYADALLSTLAEEA